MMPQTERLILFLTDRLSWKKICRMKLFKLKRFQIQSLKLLEQHQRQQHVCSSLTDVCHKTHKHRIWKVFMDRVLIMRQFEGKRTRRLHKRVTRLKALVLSVKQRKAACTWRSHFFYLSPLVLWHGTEAAFLSNITSRIWQTSWVWALDKNVFHETQRRSRRCTSVCFIFTCFQETVCCHFINDHSHGLLQNHSLRGPDQMFVHVSASAAKPDPEHFHLREQLRTRRLLRRLCSNWIHTLTVQHFHILVHVKK